MVILGKVDLRSHSRMAFAAKVVGVRGVALGVGVDQLHRELTRLLMLEKKFKSQVRFWREHDEGQRLDERNEIQLTESSN